MHVQSKTSAVSPKGHLAVMSLSVPCFDQSGDLHQAFVCVTVCAQDKEQLYLSTVCDWSFYHYVTGKSYNVIWHGAAFLSLAPICL